MLKDRQWKLPDTWQLSTIKELGQVIAGGTPSTKRPEYWGGEIKWITPADLSGYNDKYISSGRTRLSYEGLINSSAKLMPAGSVHFSSRAPIGYVVISSEPICTNQGLKSVVPAPGLFNEYLYYYLKSAKQIAEEMATGTTFKEISARVFGELYVPVPPTCEQHQIVSKIEELFSELDNGIESLKKAREQLKTYRQAVLKHAFEGKLTAEWRARQMAAGNPPGSLRRNCWNASGGSGKGITGRSWKIGRKPAYTQRRRAQRTRPNPKIQRKCPRSRKRNWRSCRSCRRGGGGSNWRNYAVRLPMVTTSHPLSRHLEFHSSPFLILKTIKLISREHFL